MQATKKRHDESSTVTADNLHEYDTLVSFFRQRLCQKLAALAFDDDDHDDNHDHQHQNFSKDEKILKVEEELGPLFCEFFARISTKESWRPTTSSSTTTSASSTNGLVNSTSDAGQGSHNHKVTAVDDKNKPNRTPVLVACEKPNYAAVCLKYLVRLYEKYSQRGESMEKALMDQLLGDCLHSSSCADGNNKTMHFIASSSSTIDSEKEALVYLANILMYQHPLNNYSLEEACLQLLSQKNDHGDTPFMMAAVKGKRSWIEFWIQLIIRDQSCSTNSIQKDRIVELLVQRNHSNDTTLSLAYGHGHYEIVEFLINGQTDVDNKTTKNNGLHDGLVQVQYDDVQRCRKLLEKLNSLQDMILTTHEMEKKKNELDKIQRSIQKCYDLLLDALTKYTDEISNHLLLDDEIHQGLDLKPTSNSITRRQTVAAHTQKTKKKKKKTNRTPTMTRNKTKGQPSHDNVTLEENEKDGNVRKDGVSFEKDPITLPKFVTMQDGSVVSSSSSAMVVNASLPYSGTATKITASSYSSKPINHLLRERCSDTWNREAEELMEALCLDASMLLLSSQSMAMNLSPSQLETVETVLQLQLKAVDTAKKIHGRLMSQTSRHEES